jgi:hypothetical protein
MRITSALRRHATRRHVPTVCLASIVVALHPVMVLDRAPAPSSAPASVPGYEVTARLCVTPQSCGSLTLTVRTSPDRFLLAPSR